MHNVFARLMATFKRLRSRRKPRSDMNDFGKENKHMTNAASEPMGQSATFFLELKWMHQLTL
jgi:hypothetical protein